MGVMACRRNGCENILCDRYSVEYGYICDTCFEEMATIKVLNIKEFLNSRFSNPKDLPPHRDWYESVFPRQSSE